ncbi:MAG: hypothetical protein WCP06_01955 [Verrucomicrobiota bacterium]
MKIKRPVVGKILCHTNGLGVPSPETVRERALELARIEGRTEYTDEDWKRAFRELHGGHHGNENEATRAADDEMIDTASERDMVAPTLGHHNGHNIDGGDCIGEELVAEGLDEADHDRMLASRRLENAETEEEEPRGRQ